MKEFLKKYWLYIVGLVIIIIVLLVVYYTGRKSTNGNIVIKDDSGNPVTLPDTDKAQAVSIAARIYNDINSGWLFGQNIWGNLGRDSDAYQQLAAMSDTEFAYTCQVYFDTYKKSLVADFRGETSLPGGGYYQTILDKASRLNIS